MTAALMTKKCFEKCSQTLSDKLNKLTQTIAGLPQARKQGEKNHRPGKR